MTFQEAIAFLKMKSEDKDQILQMIFAGDKYAKTELPSCSHFYPSRKYQNAVEAGIIKPENAAFTEKNLVVNYTDNTMYKYNLF